MKTSIKYLVFLLFMTQTIWAADKISLSSSEIQKLNYNQLQQVRASYIHFVMVSSRDYELQPETSYTKFLQKIQFIQSAYSDNPGLCFFGGWPSKMASDHCRAPWRERDDQLVQEYGSYTTFSSCGSPSEFRCNPILFGSPSDDIVAAGSPVNGIEVNFNPAKNGNVPGYCVKTNGSFQELTQKCEKASRGSINDIIDDYKSNPQKLEKFSKAVGDFCKAKPEYDACDDLGKRIGEITGQGFDTNTVSTLGDDKIPSYAKAILDKCSDITSDDDIKDRELFGSLVYEKYECIPPEINSISSMSEIESLKGELEKNEVLNQINQQSFYQTLKALVANEFKYGMDKTFDMAYPDAFVLSILKKYPQLKSNDEFRELAKMAYDEVEFAYKNDDLVPLEASSVATQFNELAAELNAECVKVYNEFKGRRKENWFKRAGRWLKGHALAGTSPYYYAEYQADKAVQETLQNQFKPRLNGRIQALVNGSEIGHLLTTDYFKDNIIDLTDNFAKECATNPKYNLIKEPLRNDEIKKGHKELSDKMKDNISKVAKTQGYLNIGDRYNTNKELKNFIKDDPTTAFTTLLNIPEEHQAAYGAHMCSQVKDIYRTDKNWRLAERVAGGVGVVAGGILIATGLGAPIGASLVGASMSAMGIVGAVTGLGAIEKWEDANSREIANDLAIVEKRMRNSRYIEEFNKTQDQKWESYKQGGLAALEMIPAIRVTRIYPMARALPAYNGTTKALGTGTKALSQGSRGGQRLLTEGVKASQRSIAAGTKTAPRLNLLSGTKGFDKFLKNSKIQKLLEELKTVQKRINTLRARGKYGLGEVEYARMHKNKYSLIRKLEAVFARIGGRPSEVKQFVKRILSRQT